MLFINSYQWIINLPLNASGFKIREFLLAESFSCDEAFTIEYILIPDSLMLRISIYAITLTLNTSLRTRRKQQNFEMILEIRCFVKCLFLFLVM